LITATGLKLATALRKHPLGPVAATLLAMACFVSVAWLRLPLVFVLLGVGGLACGLTYRKLGEAA
jgi:chromate transporter